ncbi:mitotic-spindle organizing protein 2 isoform X1 [Amphiprion ocellaris]|uniref:Mitotic spindle organizing protein 2B n=1 Tax=Amphiprion ocellaris TaxID=80972 RepID=A0AAQ5X2D6_AMPOC|nr:mitotic-spindle organizing protein 2 isoform X1 [Amphiprion ocellaris]XP_023123018.1 mitotic-spindle organizing protein 2 isoform X1 [Amphiprion ocellaris]XP_035802712.1 mitotic-spindle organizing protein 2 isoform X1 [Amphiprion ocellaris]
MSQQQQQTIPSAPDSPALVVTTNVQKYAIKKKKVLSAEEMELFELTQAAGITVDQEVFKIIVDLLKMNVAPQAVFQTLKAMCAGQRVAESCGAESSTASHTTSMTTAPTEAREEDSLVSRKSPKPPAAPPSASGPRATRVNTKIVVYGPQDVSSPHSQAVRSKAAASHSEKSREASSQRVQRQPSATRGQKIKSSGSSSSSSQINST